jgi:hypothetical protein
MPHFSQRTRKFKFNRVNLRYGKHVNTLTAELTQPARPAHSTMFAENVLCVIRIAVYLFEVLSYLQRLWSVELESSVHHKC